jgi:hypothetical protein
MRFEPADANPVSSSTSAGATVKAPQGAIAQLVERVHGMDEAVGSIPTSSTSTLVEALHLVGGFFGGLIAGEGSFLVTSVGSRADGTERLRFRLSVRMASWDRPLLEALRRFLGVGSIHDAPPARIGWQPSATYTVGSRRAVEHRVLPFADRYLLRPSQKFQDYTTWRSWFLAYQAQHPSRWAAGRSTCRIAGCSEPIRGQGLCRRHYYRATGH